MDHPAGMDVHIAQDLASRLRPLAWVIGIVISVGPAIIFLALGLASLTNTAKLDARVLSQRLQEIVLDSPSLWQYSAEKYAQILSDFLPRTNVASIEVLDEGGRPVLGYRYVTEASGKWWNRYAPSRSARILFNNRTLGAVRVALPLGGLLAETGLLFVACVGVGISLAWMVYGFPVRVVAGLEAQVRDLVDSVRGANRELSQTQDQLIQAQRMEAVGRLAGGVAHDFNNLLTLILGHSHLLLDRLEADNPMRAQIELIRTTGERAAGLTRQLLSFSRKQVLHPTVLDLTAVVTGLTSLLRRLVGEDVRFVIAPGPALGRIRADQGQLEQVLANLVINARDAMPDGGQITIRTANVQLDAAFSARHPEVRPGAYVMLAVGDTGSGMTPEVQAQIFEPFFTTKEVGKGTGLGLSTVYGIVTQHEGAIVVESEPGRGSTFTVYLPRVDEASTPATAVATPAAERQGTETILLVEDEVGVRALARDVLTMRGYTVLEATNGSAALRIAAQAAGPIHLLLTDVVMPGLNGRETADRLKVSHPDMRVLYMSGYTDDAIVHHGVLGPGTALLPKPFTPPVLARKVREMLDAPAAPKGPADSR